MGFFQRHGHSMLLGLFLLALAVVSPASGVDVAAGEAGRPKTASAEKLDVLTGEAVPVIERQDTWLLVRDIRAVLERAGFDELVAILKSEIAKRDKHVEAGGKPGAFDLRPLGNLAGKLRRLRRRVEDLAWQRGWGKFAGQIVNAEWKGGIAAVQDLCLKLAAADTTEKIVAVLEDVPESLSLGKEMAAKLKTWSEKDPERLRALAAANRDLIREARTAKDPAGFHALAFAIELDRILEDSRGVEKDVASLQESAGSFFEADEARWVICQVADLHLDRHRWDLAAGIYRIVFDPPFPVREGGELPASIMYAGLRLVRCDWKSGTTAHAKIEDGQSWTILQRASQANRIPWDERLYKAYFYLVNNVVPVTWHPHESVDIKAVYCRFLMKNASTEDLRHRAGMSLGGDLARAKRNIEAAEVYEQLVDIVDSQNLKRIYGRRALKLRGKLPRRDWPR